MAQGGLDETLLPPLWPVSREEKGAYILLTAVIMIVLSGLTIAAKLQMTVSTFRRLRNDDVALVVAFIFAVVYTVSMGLAVKNGLGRTGDGLAPSDIARLSQYYYAANIIAWPSIASSKCAVALLIIAIEPARRWIAATLRALLAICAFWGFAASFVFAFQCSPKRYVLGPSSTHNCFDQYGAQLGVRLIDIATDIALCLLPAVMMSYVQILPSKKLQVSFMFGLRLVVPAITAVSLASLYKFYGTPTQTRPFHAVYPSIWTCLMVNLSLLTACLPSIRRVLADWASGISNANILQAFELTESANRTRSGRMGGTDRSQSRSYLRSSNHFGIDSKSRGEQRADDNSHNYFDRTRRHPERSSEDTESKRRLTDGITQTVDYSVEFEAHGGRVDKDSSFRRR